MANLKEVCENVKNELRANNIYPVRAMSNIMNSGINHVGRMKQKNIASLTKEAQYIAENLFYEHAEKEQIDFSGDYNRVSTSVLSIPNTQKTKVTVSFEYVGRNGFGAICLDVLFDMGWHEAEISLTQSNELPKPTVIEVGIFYCPQTSFSSNSVFEVLLSCVDKFGTMQYPDDVAQSLRRWFIKESQVTYGVLQKLHGSTLPAPVLKEGLQSLVKQGLLEYDEETDTYCLTNHKPAGDLEY
jgi:hypothetical protein